MNVTKRYIKTKIISAETNLNFCWNLLADLKTSSIKKEGFAERFITFQDKLALTIFELQQIRDKIIIEEKRYVKNKNHYNNKWFVSKMRFLAKNKDAIDSVVNISKALGDAFAFYFYQFDRELLSKHSQHQRIINNTSGIGERGELEFIKNIKQLDGQFTLYHGITNILRYGDYSFIDLRKLKVERIGELKTKKIDDETLNLNIAIIHRNDLKNKKEPINDSELNKTRKGRQLLGIANFLIENKDDIDSNIEMENPYYSKEIDSLIKKSRIKGGNCIQVSSGLAFLCLKLKKSSLYYKLFRRDIKLPDEFSNKITETGKNLAKDPKKHNSIVIGQLLYNKDLSDKNTSGTVPLFWHPIDVNLLRGLYFIDYIVISLFNPIYLIEEIEQMGFKIESKYSNNSQEINLQKTKGIKQFDFFISYIINFLFHEYFVIESLREVEKIQKLNKKTMAYVRPFQHINIMKK